MRVLSVARDLQRRHARERHGLFVAEGVRTVDELLRSTLTIRGALVAPPLPDLAHGRSLVAALHERGVAVQEVSAAEFASAADTETPQGILAIAQVPKHSLAALPIDAPFRLLVLDAVQDPGNVGTIVRTAAALGVAAIVSLPGTVDLWNAKVVRSSMGALFHHPALACTWEELTSFRSQHAVPLWGADSAGESLSGLTRTREAIPPRLAIAVGNEGSGIGAQVRQGAERLVSVEIASTVESLNVAVATGILLYELR